MIETKTCRSITSEKAKNSQLLTIKQFAELAGVSTQTVYRQLSTRLNEYCQPVGNRKMLQFQALADVFGVRVEQPIQPKVVNSFNPKINPETSSEVLFLRSQVERLQAELAEERAHSREKDKQLLETLSKLAESQAALASGQAAEKQKVLADTIIEGRQQLSAEAVAPTKQSWLARLRGRGRQKND